jgi:hypothetical protein
MSAIDEIKQLFTNPVVDRFTNIQILFSALLCSIGILVLWVVNSKSSLDASSFIDILKVSGVVFVAVFGFLYLYNLARKYGKTAATLLPFVIVILVLVYLWLSGML